MRERTLLFGEAKSLVGVITEPAADAPAADRPALVLINAGILHRVGPNRLHVTLARTLAGDGVVSMRFDYSGIGDSRPRASTVSFARAAVDEVRQCMDVLSATRGATRFVLAGLCSGADNALRVAEADERVVGALLMEPYSVPTRGYHLWSYRGQLRRPGSWWRLLTGQSELWSLLRDRLAARRVAAARPRDEEPAAAPEDAVLLGESQYAQQVRSAVAAGVRLCIVLSAGNPSHYHYGRLLRRGLAEAQGRGAVRVEVLPGTDHAFTPLDTQSALVRLAREWTLGLTGAAPRVRRATG